MFARNSKHVSFFVFVVIESLFSKIYRYNLLERM